MNYCIIRGTGVIFLSKKELTEHIFVPSATPAEDRETSAENGATPQIIDIIKNLKNSGFKEFLVEKMGAFCAENGPRLSFILDTPWFDVRVVALPPHKKGMTRQILALNLSSEFINEIENIIFDFYTRVDKDSSKIEAVVYACSRQLSELINSACLQVSAVCQGILPYGHLVENRFESENGKLADHIHIEAGKSYTHFLVFKDGSFVNFLGLLMTGDTKLDLNRIKRRLSLLLTDSTVTTGLTVNHVNGHLYPYLEGENDELPEEVNEDNSFKRIDDLVAKTKKNRRYLNLTRIQNPLLLDILRSRKDFIKVAAVYGGILILYIGFKGAMLYLTNTKFEQLNNQVLSSIRRVVPDAQSVQATLSTLSKRRDDLQAIWKSRQELSYRSYGMSGFIQKLDSISNAVAGSNIQNLRYEDDYIEYTGTVLNLNDISQLKTANENEFKEYDVDIEERNIDGNITFTLKLSKKNAAAVENS